MSFFNVIICKRLNKLALVHLVSQYHFVPEEVIVSHLRMKEPWPGSTLLACCISDLIFLVTNQTWPQVSVGS